MGTVDAGQSLRRAHAERSLGAGTILADAPIHTMIVNRGHQGVDVTGARILHSGQRREVTRSIKAMIKRRSAIEPALGHTKADGKLGHNWHKGQLGDALHVLCGAGHNIRLLLSHLRFFACTYLWIMAAAIHRPATATNAVS